MKQNMPETSREWDRRLDEAFERASLEASEADHAELSRMLTMLRLYLSHWQEIAQSRFRAMGIHALSESEYTSVVRLVADEVARQTVDAARDLVDQKRRQWWEHWAVKVGIFVALASLLASTIIGIINIMLNLSAAKH